MLRFPRNADTSPLIDPSDWTSQAMGLEPTSSSSSSTTRFLRYLTLPLRSSRDTLNARMVKLLTIQDNVTLARLKSRKCLNFLPFKTTNLPFQPVTTILCSISMVLVLILWLNRTVTILTQNCFNPLLVAMRLGSRVVSISCHSRQPTYHSSL